MLWQAITTTALCALKFMVGVAVGLALPLSTPTRWLCFVLGGVLGTTIYAYLGDALKRWVQSWRKQPKAPKPTPTWLVQVWQRYGLIGLVLITPPLLGPPVGVPLAIALGAPRGRVALWMGISVAVWATVFALAGEPLRRFILG